MANNDPCDVAGPFDWHRTATPSSQLAVTGSFGAELWLMSGKISGLGVDLCVSFCHKPSIAHVFRKARASPMRPSLNE